MPILSFARVPDRTNILCLDDVLNLMMFFFCFVSDHPWLISVIRWNIVWHGCIGVHCREEARWRFSFFTSSSSEQTSIGNGSAIEGWPNMIRCIRSIRVVFVRCSAVLDQLWLLWSVLEELACFEFCPEYSCNTWICHCYHLSRGDRSIHEVLIDWRPPGNKTFWTGSAVGPIRQRRLLLEVRDDWHNTFVISFDTGSQASSTRRTPGMCSHRLCSIRMGAPVLDEDEMMMMTAHESRSADPRPND